MFFEKVRTGVLALLLFVVTITRIHSQVYIAKDIDPNNTFRDVTFNVSALRTCLSKCILNQCYYVNYTNQTCDLFGRSLSAISTGNITWDGHRQEPVLNIAGPDKITSQSSNFNPTHYLSSWAVDGSLSTFSMTGSEKNPWWMIDLRQGYFITSLQFQLQSLSRFHSVTIYLSNSSVAPTPATFQQLSVFATYQGPAPTLNWIINATVPIMWGRFLVVQLNTTGILDMYEIYIFAMENNWP